MNIFDIIVTIVNLVLIESLLSVDNAAVLAIMVKDLPDGQRGKALKWGMWGAFFFRGLCLFFVSKLMTITWLKIVGGALLFWIVFKWLKDKFDDSEKEETKVRVDRWIYKVTVGKFGKFWATVILVELMDLSLSIDNVFVAVGLSPDWRVVTAGVIIGIITMRYVAVGFTKIIEKYPQLESSAFIVIGLVGIKLVLSGLADNVPGMEGLKPVFDSHTTDFWFSVFTMAIFFFPLFNKKKAELYVISYALDGDIEGSERTVVIEGYSETGAIQNAHKQLSELNLGAPFTIDESSIKKHNE